MKPKISVVLPVYNGEKYLRNAINSILGQSFKDFELLIIDDASQDSSFNIIKSFKDKRIKVLSNKKNQGLAKTLNAGISQARAPIIARMDQDDISLPHRLKKQSSYLTQHHYHLLGTWFQDIDHQAKVIKKLYRLTQPSDLKKALLIGNYFCHGSLMFRKSVWKKVGGYRKKFDYAEDYDFISRVALIPNSKLGNISQPLYRHRVNPQGMSLSQTKRQTKVGDIIRQRNFKHWQQYYSPGYQVSSNKSENKFKKEVAKKLAKLFFKKKKFKPALLETYWWLNL